MKRKFKSKRNKFLRARYFYKRLAVAVKEALSHKLYGTPLAAYTFDKVKYKVVPITNQELEQAYIESEKEDKDYY